jgi:2-polyprenyl-3-methyl-5-hydroxy-6-metoxy-1,4-benzoquinol methylase
MTNINNVENYGWTSEQSPESCGYITPRILEILKQLGAMRILDIGTGNGALCSELAAAGYQET